MRYRDAVWGLAMDGLWQDLRQAFRATRRNPEFDVSAAAVALMILLPTPVWSQSYDPTTYFKIISSNSHGDTVTVSVPISAERLQRFPLVRNAPFSGEERDEIIHWDETEPRLSSRPSKMWRDSEGRIRVELPAFRDPRAEWDSLPPIVEICDSATTTMFVLDMEHRIAHRFSCEPVLTPQQIAAAHPTAPSVHTAPPTDPLQPVRKVERLGSQNFGDAIAEGTRITETVPTGYEGNDRPIASSTEEWVSEELKLCVYRKNVNPRAAGTMIREVVNIHRAAPDAALFQVPPGFTVVDETAAFEFTLSRSR